MQKIKINNKLITILFIVYLIISFFINSVKMIYDYFDEVEIGTDFNKESFIALYHVLVEEVVDHVFLHDEELHLIMSLKVMLDKDYISIFLLFWVSALQLHFLRIFFL